MDRSKIIFPSSLFSRVVLGLTSFGAIVCGRAGIIGLVAAAVVSSFPADAGERGAADPATIMFVCEHGAVKSIVAAAHFNRIARERGLPFVAVSRGVDLYKEIPASVRVGLSRDGLVPVDDTPRELSAEEAAGAAELIAFDPVPAERGGGAAVTYWSDVPPVLKNYDAARDAIVQHLEALADSLAARH